MKLAYILFDDVTLLDFIGVYDAVSRLKSMHYLPHLSWDICAQTPQVKDNFGLQIQATVIAPSLAGYEAIIVPGGYGTRLLQSDKKFIAWLQTTPETALKTSVCTGSLLLGAAGFLKDKRATTHYREYDALKPYCRTVLTDRIVEDGDVITAGAVSTSIDLGLFLCRKWAGDAAAAEIQKRMAFTPMGF
ncbi:MAG TPA: DJ-1/PfpI family protein [Chitinophagaceae bacterium]|nr:DJ-1/PfpI family protein [Chitinophagaceae bacterium]